VSIFENELGIKKLLGSSGHVFASYWNSKKSQLILEFLT
jgi:hypothetical protein